MHGRALSEHGRQRPGGGPGRSCRCRRVAHGAPGAGARSSGSPLRTEQGLHLCQASPGGTPRSSDPPTGRPGSSVPGTCTRPETKGPPAMGRAGEPARYERPWGRLEAAHESWAATDRRRRVTTRPRPASIRHAPAHRCHRPRRRARHDGHPRCLRRLGCARPRAHEGLSRARHPTGRTGMEHHEVPGRWAQRPRGDLGFPSDLGAGRHHANSTRPPGPGQTTAWTHCGPLPPSGPPARPFGPLASALKHREGHSVSSPWNR